jgi:hypothetical protein
MFLKGKFLSTGELDKLKARLVAGGNMQDRSNYGEGDFAAPTVSLTSVYTVCSLAAMDVPGAFLNSDLEIEVIMILEPALAKILADLSPGDYKKFLRSDGSLILQLDKGLYGLGESAKLWHDNIHGQLLAMGFKSSAKDPCVLFKTVDGDRLTVCLYVDDLLVTGRKALHSALCKLYGAVTYDGGELHSYLGQIFDFREPFKC